MSDDRNLGLIAAGVAFFSMLAIFPGIAALISIWGIFADPVVIESQLELLARFVPEQAFRILERQVNALIGANESTLGWTTLISTLAAIWSARAGVAALIRGLNAIYRESNRPGLKHYIAALLLTLALVGVGLISMTSVVIAPLAIAFFPLGDFTTNVLEVTRWTIAFLVAILGLGIVYRFGPNRRHARIGWISPGAVVAVVIWGALSVAFSYYLSNFGNYNEVYGSIGAVIALLMWFYISAYVVLMGAVVNAQLELRTRRDSTVGPDRPMGQRGAYVADHLVRDES